MIEWQERTNGRWFLTRKYEEFSIIRQGKASLQTWRTPWNLLDASKDISNFHGARTRWYWAQNEDSEKTHTIYNYNTIAHPEEPTWRHVGRRVVIRENWNFFQNDTRRDETFSSRAYDLTIDKSIYTLGIRHALVDKTFVRLWGEWQMNASRRSFLFFYFFKRATRLSVIKLLVIISLPKSFNKCFVSWLLAEPTTLNPQAFTGCSEPTRPDYDNSTYRRKKKWKVCRTEFVNKRSVAEIVKKYWKKNSNIKM